MPENNGTQYTDPPQSRNEAIVEAIINETEYTDPPQSENEEILVSILNGTPYEKTPQSRFADLLIQLKDFIETGGGGGGGGGRPKVPQTGTWQFKLTPQKGLLIIGKDDDTADEAMFVRMVSGYGFKFVLNTEAVDINKNLTADIDTTYSLYPSGTEAHFPNGCTVTQLAKYVNENHLGEIAQHDESSKTLWNSTNLDDYISEFYETYTAGGGTKTETEFKDAILDKYKDTDIAQGASRVVEQREVLEEAVGFYILTIGAWGGTPNIVIDDIIVGTFQNLKTNFNTLARQNNYYADSWLANYGPGYTGSLPYSIVRESSFTEANAESLCEALYTDRWCAEIFGHAIINYNTQAEWEDFKAVLDKIKTYVDANKIEVITRKELYSLGEFVAHPIVSLEFQTDATEYLIGTTLTEANFTCKAVLNDNTKVNCESDKIIDLSHVDTDTAGTYPVVLYYRGHKTTINVSIVSGGMILPEYVQQATSGYYQTFRFATNEDICYCIYLNEASAGFDGGAYTYGGAWIWRPKTRPSSLRVFYSADGSATWTQLCDASAPQSIKSNTATYFGEHTFGASQNLNLSNVVHITS